MQLADELRELAVRIAPLGSASGDTRWDVAEMMRTAADTAERMERVGASLAKQLSVAMTENSRLKADLAAQQDVREAAPRLESGSTASVMTEHR